MSASSNRTPGARQAPPAPIPGGLTAAGEAERSDAIILFGPTGDLARKKLYRNHPRKCTACQGPMRKVSEKNEDEYIAGLRLSSLLWAVCVSYLLLLIAFVLVYGTPFLNVMVYNMFTVLIIFIIRFNYLLHKNSKIVPDEK